MNKLTPEEKFELRRKVRARGDISANDRLIYDTALDYYKGSAGGLVFPGAKTLGSAVALTERTVRKGLLRLKAKRVLSIQPRRGRTPLLHFPHPQHIPTPEGAPSAPTPEGIASAPRDEDPGIYGGGVRKNGARTPEGAPSDETLNIETRESDASPLPRKGEASASQRGFQDGARNEELRYPTDDEKTERLAKWELVKRQIEAAVEAVTHKPESQRRRG